MKTKNKLRVCYVVCYKDPDYVRTESLVAALRLLPEIELSVIKNRRRGPLRYIEVPARLLWIRLRLQPDVFIVGFRAHEIFWAFYPSMIGKKIIFDEFVDHHDWLVSEHKKSWSRWFVRIMDTYMKLVMRLSAYIFTDTEAHAELAVRNYDVPADKVKAIPVGADEKIFFLRPEPKKKNDRYEVFFFGNLLPLHGLDVMLEAIKMLAAVRQINVHFSLAGGRGNPQMLKLITDFMRDNKLREAVTHYDWIPYSELPAHIASSDLCLGGPFGVTGQADRVVTGKTYQFLAMGKPTVVGANQATGLFRNKENCLLVERGSAAALAEAIYWAVGHQTETAAIGRRGRRLFDKEFSSKIIAAKLEALIYD